MFCMKTGCKDWICDIISTEGRFYKWVRIVKKEERVTDDDRTHCT